MLAGTVISKDGTKIAFDKTGSGPAVILVNGAIAYRAMDTSLAAMAELLSDRFTVYNYDRRGRGESGDTAPYAKEREFEDLAALIEDAGGTAMVVGFSSGGALVLDAVQSGLNIRKIVLYEVPLIVNDSRPPVPADYVEHLTRLARENRRAEAVEYFLVNAAGIPAEYLGGMQQSPAWPGMLSVAHTIAYDGAFVAEAMQGKPLPAGRWSRVTIPALVVYGSASPAGWMDATARAIAALLPRAELQVLEGQDHNVAPDRIAPLIAEFFRRP